MSSVGTFDSCLCALGDTSGLEVEGWGGVCQETQDETKTGVTALMEGIVAVGFPISLENIWLRWEV